TARRLQLPQPARSALGPDQTAHAQPRLQQSVGAESDRTQPRSPVAVDSDVYLRHSTVRCRDAESEAVRRAIHVGQQLPGAADAAVFVLTDAACCAPTFNDRKSRPPRGVASAAPRSRPARRAV